MTLPPWYPRKDYEAACAHWARVRKGLHCAAPHTYAANDKETIEAHRFQARMHIERAAEHMRRAEELSFDETETSAPLFKETVP